MTATKKPMTFATFLVAVMALTLLAGATAAHAQDREGSWEFSLGAIYQFSNELDSEGGSTMDTGGDFGFSIAAGYNFTDKLETTFGFQYASIDYDASVIQDNRTSLGIEGTYDSWVLSANMIFNLIDGPITPYIGAGIGWSFIDSNVPSGLPSTGCWWDPWWGYVCYTSYPTYTDDAFSYQALAGVRWELNDMTYLRLNYTSQWMEIGNADGTPRFDVMALEVGWMF